MDEVGRLAAIEDIRKAKARYLRGVDTSDGPLVRSVLTEDCVLDYMGCCTDPASGRDFLPQMNIVMRGRAAWSDGGFASQGIVSTHHGHSGEVEITGEATAEAVWPFTDRLFMPAGAPFACLIGYGYYHETYEKTGGGWQIKTLRITRLRVETI